MDIFNSYLGMVTIKVDRNYMIRVLVMPYFGNTYITEKFIILIIIDEILTKKLHKSPKFSKSPKWMKSALNKNKV